jgi:hypothetical protein
MTITHPCKLPARQERAGLPTGLARSKVVMIGRPFAAPYLWIPAHLLPAAPNKAASSSP